MGNCGGEESFSPLLWSSNSRWRTLRFDVADPVVGIEVLELLRVVALQDGRSGKSIFIPLQTQPCRTRINQIDVKE